MKILYIDDNEQLRTVVTTFLSRLNHEVEVAKDGREGVEIFAKKNGAFDVVITDYEMPRMDGLEVIRAIRGMNTGVRIIFTSTHLLGMNTEFEYQAREGGADALLPKPFMPTDLLTFLSPAPDTTT